MNEHETTDVKGMQGWLRIENLAGLLAVTLAVTSAVTLTAGCGKPEAADGDLSGWNVLLVTLDTTRRDHIGCYGKDGAGTETIDTLARGGVVFDEAVAQAPITLPTHSSIMTGLYPPQHGVRGNGFYALPEEQTTLAESLAGAGYDTGAVVAARVLDRRFGLAQGFRLFDDDPADMSPAFAGAEYTRDAATVTDAALRVIDSLHADRPFFLWVHYFDPHFPYTPPADIAGAFDSTLLGKYQAEIAHVDRHLGRLLDSLGQRGLRERTLIVLTADHGEGVGGPHAEKGHGVFVYGETMRVPLIIHAGSRIAAGSRRDSVIRQIDIAPTILDLVGVEHDGDVEGISYRPLLLDRAGTAPVDEGFDRIDSYGEAMIPWQSFGWSPLFQLRDRRWKFIEAPTPELYDLRADPDEQHNLAADNPEIVARYRARLADILGSGSGADAFSGSLATSPEDRAMLEALGYVGSARPAAVDDRRTAFANLKDPKEWLHISDRIHQARARLVNGQLAQARRELEQVLAVDAGNLDAQAVLIDVLLAQNDLDAAERRLQTAAAERPDIAATWMSLARIARRRAGALATGDAPGAREQLLAAGRHLERAAALERYDIAALVQLATLKLDLRSPTEAEAALRRAEERDPRDYRVRYLLGVTLLQLGRRDEALDSLRDALEATGDRARLRAVHLKIAETGIDGRDLETARPSIDWLQREFPADPATANLRQRADDLSVR